MEKADVNALEARYGVHGPPEMYEYFRERWPRFALLLFFGFPCGVLDVISQPLLMTAESLFSAFRERIIGRRVRRRRLAGNSLLVYVDADPGDQTGLTLWFEPTWHLRDSARVLTGSRQAQHDPDAADPNAGFNSAAIAVDVLVDRTVVGLDIADVTGDLILSLEGGFCVTTFVSDPTSEELWHIRDNATKWRLRRTAVELQIVPEVC